MSAFVEVTPELMAGFLDEAPEYLSTLDEGLMTFEAQAGDKGVSLEDPQDQERMNGMFRAAHSLKGLAATMGFDEIRDLTHLMETLFDHVRMGKRVLNATAIETLFGVFDKLRALVEALSEAPAEPLTIADELETLQAILDSPSGHPSQAEPSAPSEPLPAPASNAPDNGGCPALTNALVDDSDLMQRFVEASLETVEGLNEQLLKLENAPADSEILNEIFRHAHNLKGASGAVGCNTLFRLTHDMETVLDNLRDGQLVLDDDLLTVLFHTLDRLQKDLATIRDGRGAELTAEGIEGKFSRWLVGEAPKGESASEAPAQTQTVAADPAPGCDDPDVLVVKVTFPKESDEAELTAFLIHNKLAELGDIALVTPDLDSLDPEAPLEQVVYHVHTKAEEPQVEELVRNYGVASVQAVRGGSAAGGGSATSDSSAAPAIDVQCSSKDPATAPSESSNVASSPAAPVPAMPRSGTSGQAASGKRAPAGKGTTAGADSPPLKKQETIRVDLERLDQLMNLGGELVISKARLVQVESKLGTAFAGKSLVSLADDLSGRLHRVREALEQVRGSNADRQALRSINDELLHLADDYDPVRQLAHQVQESRQAMADFSEAVHGLNRISEGIQKRVMQTRMVSVGPLFQRFRRVVRDIAKSTSKKVTLVLNGEHTELDKQMIDELGDPLTHMIRNSVDHGLESPEERLAAGKPEVGQVELNAFHLGRHICIQVKDDGRGLDVEVIRKKIPEKGLASPVQVESMSDKEVMQYIFKPGFSTAQQVSDLSGRGMGMDIVTSKIDAINGTVDLDSVPGKGTTVTINLPLTLAIIPALVARIGQCTYAVPLETVGEIITVRKKDIQHVHRKRVVQVRNRVIPVALLEQILHAGRPELYTESKDAEEVTLVVLCSQNDRIGLVVDEMIGQEDVVIKSIATNYQNIAGVAGASIMGDGSVALILDVAALRGMFAERGDSSARTGPAPAMDVEVLEPAMAG
ncbi:MAG: Hpt domain-containing protein [Phycisphaerae bacterium]